MVDLIHQVKINQNRPNHHLLYVDIYIHIMPSLFIVQVYGVSFNHLHILLIQDVFLANVEV